MDEASAKGTFTFMLAVSSFPVTTRTWPLPPFLTVNTLVEDDCSGQTRVTTKEVLAPEHGRSRCPGALARKMAAHSLCVPVISSSSHRRYASAISLWRDWRRLLTRMISAGALR